MTFGSQAARRMQKLYPQFTEVVYFPSSEVGVEQNGVLFDAVCLPEQMARTGFHTGAQARIARPDSRNYVIAEVTQPYHCSLLVKPGTRLKDVRRVLGHTGSLPQCSSWLTKHLPDAEIVIVKSHTMGAAQAVAEGDGSVASVGTSHSAKQFGLGELATDIDGGSTANFWAVSPLPFFDDAPTRALVVARCCEDGQLTALVGALAETGFRLHTVYSQASGRRLFEYDYVLRFGGIGTLAPIRKALAGLSSARLAGAFEAREDGCAGTHKKEEAMTRES